MPVETHLPVNASVDDLMLKLMRDAFAGTDVAVVSKVSETTPRPMVWIRSDRRSGNTVNKNLDTRFANGAIVSVQTIHDGADGRDSDVVAEQLQEAVRVAFQEAIRSQRVYPGLGSLARAERLVFPSRVADWGDSTNVVQYATLPSGWERWSSVYRVTVRPPHPSTVNNPYVRSVPRA